MIVVHDDNCNTYARRGGGEGVCVCCVREACVYGARALSLSLS